ncbi:MAG: hypothetical protein V4505_07275 [Pseudomonadota bacterium]
MKSPKAGGRFAGAALAAGMLAMLAGCDQKPPSWDSLIAARITQQYPAYQTVPQPGGGLTVERPGLPAKPVDVAGIAQFCRRGPKDCDYAIDQLLLELQPPAARAGGASPAAPKGAARTDQR